MRFEIYYHFIFQRKSKIFLVSEKGGQFKEEKKEKVSLNLSASSLPPLASFISLLWLRYSGYRRQADSALQSTIRPMAFRPPPPKAIFPLPIFCLLFLPGSRSYTRAHTSRVQRHEPQATGNSLPSVPKSKHANAFFPENPRGHCREKSASRCIVVNAPPPAMSPIPPFILISMCIARVREKKGAILTRTRTEKLERNLSPGSCVE